MTVTFDNSSQSYHDLIVLLFECRWMAEDERTKITALAPFLTESERKEISVSLLIESKQHSEPQT